MSSLRVQRSGYLRKGGVRVKPTSYLAKDQGAKGRGSQILPPVTHHGALGGPGFFKKPLVTQKILAGKAADKYGEQAVQGMLARQQVFQKKEAYVDRAAMLRSYIAKHYEGKKRI